MPCLDITNDDIYQRGKDMMVEKAYLIEKELKHCNQAHMDPVRQEIDDAVATMVGLPIHTNGDCEILKNITNNWCREPSVLGKRSKIN